MAGIKDLSYLRCVREEDFVEYYLFPIIEDADEKLQESLLSNILSVCNSIVEKFVKFFIWHKDNFTLVPRTSISNTLIDTDGKNGNFPPHLYGITHYGENIEDEWFTVFILIKLTEEIPGLVVRVCDSDGEFLLIEAADYLPSWASPTTCENKVYLFDGTVHLINPDDTDTEKEVDFFQITSTIRNDPSKTLANRDIQNSILNKIKGYPDKIKDNLHHATLYLPVGVAAILNHKPSLVAAAVNSFCNRDSIDLKCCRAMKYFPPEQRVYTSVTFTKCLYAMLTYSKYLPDHRTGWNLPLSNDPDFKSHSLGVKVACGFEMLCCQAKPSQDIEGDKGWHAYLQTLKEKNYFNDLMENSRDYNNLLNKAKEYYINHRDSMYYSPMIGQEILELTKTIDHKVDDFILDKQNLPKEDDDSWLNISSEELDKMLEEKYGQKRNCKLNNNSDPSNFSEKLSTFLNHVSDVDGVEFPNQEEAPVRPSRTKKSKGKNKVVFSEDTKSGNKKCNNQINFDPNSFSSAIQNILNFVIPEDDNWNLESDSDMSDYAEDNYVKAEPYENVKTKMQEYIEAMDKELASTTIGESFEKKNGDVSGDTFEDIESFRPVDIDMNALKNILESYRSQFGDAGPSSNMLGPMGIHLENVNMPE